MIRYAEGNLLEADVEALVNTVNTVGIMGKGIALMFKEAFPGNFEEYAGACKLGEVETGRMFVTVRDALIGPRVIINFPTKEHWRTKTKLEWIEAGLVDLVRVVREMKIKSIAVPPLGCGNGGLSWTAVQPLLESHLAALDDVEVLVFPPAREYRNVAKRAGVEGLTPARALVAELVRRYWVLGISCSMLEIQKLAWFLERQIEECDLDNSLDLQFRAHKYGPYADRLRHLLNALDGSYLTSEVRVADATPSDVIAFNDRRRDHVSLYLRTEAKDYLAPLERVSKLIDGFESPLGMELLATLDWLLFKEGCPATVKAVREALVRWPGGAGAGKRKVRLFDERLIEIGLGRLSGHA